MQNTFSLFGLFLLIGAAVLAIRSNRRLGIYRRSADWPKVAGTMITSRLGKDDDSDGMAPLAEFVFRYSIAGVEYTSKLHSEGLPFPSSTDDVQRMLQRFPVGSSIQVAVNPDDASCAILDTGFPAAWNVIRRVSVIAFLVGIAIVVFGMVQAK